MLTLVGARFRKERPLWSTGAVGGIDNPCAGGRAAGAGATGAILDATFTGVENEVLDGWAVTGGWTGSDMVMG
jgi:hypothetical protein